MKAIVQLTATFYLIIFMIGGGRVCGCEILEFFGHHSCEHQHHCEHSADHHHDDDCDENEDDCCELLTPITADLPKLVEVPGVLALEVSNLFFDEQESLISWDLNFSRWNLRPPDDWVDFLYSPAALQRFLV